MKVTVHKRDLASTLRLLGKVVNKRSVLPVARMVRMEAGKNLRIQAWTPGKSFMSVEITASNIEKGTSYADHPTLVKTFKAMGNVVTLEDEGAGIKVSDGEVSVPVYGVTEEEAPTMRMEDKGVKVVGKFNTESLVKGMDDVLFSMSDDTTRSYINCLHMEMGKKGEIRMVTTDGHRITISGDVPKKSVMFDINGDSVKAVKAFLDYFVTVEDEVTISVGKEVLMMCAGEAVMEVKAANSAFPPYDASVVAPVLGRPYAILDAEDLAVAAHKACKLSRFAESKKHGTYTVEAEFRDKDVVLRPVDVEATDILVSYTGADMRGKKVHFNADYLNDAMRVTEGKVSWHVQDAESGTALVSARGWIHILMPVRVK